MAWESGLSYNARLASEVRAELEKLPVKWLAEAIANDKYSRIFDVPYKEKNAKAFDRWVSTASKLPHDVLVDDCMRRAERTNTADNGGNPIWIDKSGCSKVHLSN